MAFRWPARIRFVDTDASGRIHYTALLRHFEAAEAEFMRTLGVSYNHMPENNLAWPRVHVECDYLGALTYDDQVEIEVSVERIGLGSFTLGFEVLLENKPVARGKIVIAAMDRPTATSRPLPEQLVERLKKEMKHA